MYSLRIVEKIRDNESEEFEVLASTHELGEAYTPIPKGTRFFKKEIESCGMVDDPYIKFDKFIKGSNGIVFIVRKSEPNHRFDYYIMTNNGSTLEKVSD